MRPYCSRFLSWLALSLINISKPNHLINNNNGKYKMNID